MGEREPGRSFVRLLFSTTGRVGPRTYAAVGFGLTFLKYLIDAAVIGAVTGHFWTPFDYLSPFLQSRAEVFAEVSVWFQAGLVAWSLPFLWIGANMTIRRAFDAGLSPWFGLLFFVPILNYAVMLGLCVLKHAGFEDDDPLGAVRRVAPRHPGVRRLVVAILISLAVTLCVMTLSVAWLESYGTALFVGTPFLIGVLTAIAYQDGREESVWASVGAANVAVIACGGGLLLFAAEGAICLVMILPLAMPIATVGAFVGHTLTTMAQSSRRLPGVGAVAVLLAVAALEDEAREPERYRVDSSIEIDAPPAAVWEHVVSFSELPPPTQLVFDLGIAYPVRARIDGEGVGAVRRCEFSTGAFVEPITVWDEPNHLAFDVIEQPVPMTELSPYRDLHPPHLDGYFRSVAGEFRLQPLDGGARTLLSGTTWYDVVRTGPAPRRLLADLERGPDPPHPHARVAPRGRALRSGVARDPSGPSPPAG